jgi:hypothetical protein
VRDAGPAAGVEGNGDSSSGSSRLQEAAAPTRSADGVQWWSAARRRSKWGKGKVARGMGWGGGGVRSGSRGSGSGGCGWWGKQIL